MSDQFSETDDERADHAYAYFSKGYDEQIKNNLFSAIWHYRQALHFDPTDSSVYYNLGLAYKKQRRWKKALHAYQKAAELSPNDPTVFDQLGEVCFCLKRHSDAVEFYRKAISLGLHEDYLYCNLGRSLSKLGFYEESLPAFHKAVELNPQYASAHFHMGMAYIKLKQWGNAYERYDLLRHIDPEWAESLFHYLDQTPPELWWSYGSRVFLVCLSLWVFCWWLKGGIAWGLGQLFFCFSLLTLFSTLSKGALLPLRTKKASHFLIFFFDGLWLFSINAPLPSLIFVSAIFTSITYLAAAIEPNCNPKRLLMAQPMWIAFQCMGGLTGYHLGRLIHYLTMNILSSAG